MKFPGSFLRSFKSLEFFSEAIIILNQKGKISFINGAGALALEYEKKTLANYPFNDLLRDDYKFHNLCWDDTNLFVGKKLISLKNILKTKTGGDCYFQWKIKRLTVEEDGLNGFFLTGINNTSKHLLLQRLSRAAEDKRSAIIEAEDKLRKEIGHELHDNTCQQLITCKLLLDMELNQFKQSSLQVQKTFEIINKAIEEVRQFSHRLSPLGLENTNLKQALKELAYAINLTQSLTIKIKFHNASKIDKLPTDIATSIYRIAQEQVTNIMKYAKATTATINLYLSDVSVDLEITDNGAGFDKSHASKGIGLRSIYQRTALHSGMAYIATTPGEGCTLSVCIPIDLNS